MQSTPSELSLILAQSLGSMKLLLVASERLPESVLRTWSCTAPTFFNQYGPTEAAVDSTGARCISGAAFADSIGVPLLNFVANFVDASYNGTLVSAPGQLVVNGPQVARGYFKAPTRTI